jgi:hypothetical protein
MKSAVIVRAADDCSPFVEVAQVVKRKFHARDRNFPIKFAEHAPMLSNRSTGIQHRKPNFLGLAIAKLDNLDRANAQRNLWSMAPAEHVLEVEVLHHVEAGTAPLVVTVLTKLRHVRAASTCHVVTYAIDN